MRSKEMPKGGACGPLGEPGFRHGLPDGVLHQSSVQVRATFLLCREIDPSVSEETTRSQRVIYATRAEED